MPQSAWRACSSAVDTPESKLAPVRLQTTVWPAVSSTSASRLVTVVLPLVPTTHTLPRPSLPRRCAMSCGSTYRAILPGKLAAGRWKTCFSPQVETALTARAAVNFKPMMSSSVEGSPAYRGEWRMLQVYATPRARPARAPSLHEERRLRARFVRDGFTVGAARRVRGRRLPGAPAAHRPRGRRRPRASPPLQPLLLPPARRPPTPSTAHPRIR